MPQSSLPPSYVCPLTRRVMEDPVMDLCAHNFDRAAICEWLEQHDCCPISRKPTELTDLVTNHCLAERIERWKWRQDNRDLMDTVIKVVPPEIDDDTDQHSSSDEESFDSRGYSRVDLESGTGRKIKLNRQKSQSKPKSYYKLRPSTTHELPPHCMLLPQERQVLEVVRIRAAERLAKKRSKQLWCGIFLAIMALAVIAIGLGAAKYLIFQLDNEG